ncbi:hypothetical protein DFQ01_107126 [Paenibacillus cellulosilyticus]|uniref:Uncharacterized protein n=1 Tax=Paenibacillus cellulosilyticus TaxID=375489 RepID=A0A2V2YWQ6_9BACL|nr:hypothetical protein [Paenibacillus cellulosilyticus]PWW03229.1 hypothetical protein DFQ01_107126 [Paenibacillus cellulosilyticus]QKS43718.1 hypothetical protein HUB94_04160 [Paenibacillus cellulosilyticus]
MCKRQCNKDCAIAGSGCSKGKAEASTQSGDAYLEEKNFQQEQRATLQKKRDHLDNRIYMVRGSFIKQSWL